MLLRTSVTTPGPGRTTAPATSVLTQPARLYPQTMNEYLVESDEVPEKRMLVVPGETATVSVTVPPLLGATTVPGAGVVTVHACGPVGTPDASSTRRCT